MDEDLLALGLMLSIFILWPISMVLLIIGIASYTRTKSWDKARKTAATEKAESNPLVDPEDSDKDFYDTDDEEDIEAQRKEEEVDGHLTFNQKWRKEFCRGWKGKRISEIEQLPAYRKE
ncbi:hypothetical protein M011DRAFT_325948 [Sporormia fimetaria CBS 119925]|uniref:Uncharacterized protein n=1 Tax=Sporormia fimetaria CBS 119925 TaxID=1340428 RepID=A0A6A6VES1_9PLEO|nr:hypothetical protein M011DRAFT_325948 [Sporormia fimetaria CBS 119925]